MIICLALAGFSAIPVVRVAVPGGALAVRARSAAGVTLENVEYRLLGVSLSSRIAQRGGPTVSPSGVFAIVKLRLRSIDRRTHVISRDGLALDAGGTYYGASSPDDIGLSDKRWGAAGATTRVGAGGGLTVKVVFDVPRWTVHGRLALYIGPFGLVGQAPPRMLELPSRVSCCASGQRTPSRYRETIKRLAPDPVLGSTAAG